MKGQVLKGEGDYLFSYKESWFGILLFKKFSNRIIFDFPYNENVKMTLYMWVKIRYFGNILLYIIKLHILYNHNWVFHCLDLEIIEHIYVYVYIIYIYMCNVYMCNVYIIYQQNTISVIMRMVGYLI